MIKTRVEKEANYKGIWFNGKTIRVALDPNKPITELEYPEFYDVKLTGYCEGKCPFCFLPEQLVNTINGDKMIKNIKIDDEIITFNEEDGDIIIGPVDQLHKRKYKGDLMVLELEDGKIIKTTPNHPFYTINRGWVNAEDLTKEDELLDFKS